MPVDLHLNRRRLLQAGAGIAGLALGAGPLRQARAATDLTIGVIYVGARDDFGWNQSHAEAVQTLKTVPGIKVVEEENVPETDAVSKTMESMIALDGAGLILPTSFGYYNPFVIDEAKGHADVQFRHAAPLWTDKDPKNAGSYFAFLDQAHYVDGVAAGAASASGKLGFVAAKPIGIVLRNINSFLLGARTVNPNATVRVIFTGDWSLPVREAEATNALVDAGCDLITCHVDGPKVVIQTAESRGVKSCGHNASQAPLAPKGFVTGAEYKWATIYTGFADLLSKGQPLPNVTFGGYDKDMVKNTAFGAGATDKARMAAEAAIKDLKAGKPIWTVPVKDNKGNVVLPKAGYDNYAPELNSMTYLVDGVVGSTT
ncbi:BMP family ABC transporter substrate-binding protein [Lichenihabitans sp. Uapishka_5]|uniref:BMP family ABC transporter substrate-binding protein n=1 Tax=Lichenihabitans sp. Uapishka_5 TaxID=3037302 RepID=UPI0029E81626|nr:BMP family ABC transporter substrate-binding protein [Lichenihabitans sp. Uapishka_5]MDX7951920.1 BMP family ABC transporter substrate-binding protein [Lichenihabitans sp. Uapishka_5]